MTKRTPVKTKFRGVYYRLSPSKKFQGKPDKCYVVWYQDEHGKPRWQTIGWHSEGIRANYANQKRISILKKIESKSAGAVANPDMTIGTAVNNYTDWATNEGKHITPETDRYKLHMRAMFDAMPIKSVTHQILTTHKNNLLKKLSPASVQHCFSFVRRSINYVIGEELYTGSNPFSTSRNSRFKMPKPDNQSVRFFSPDEAKKLLQELKKRSLQIHDMSILSLKTGMRAKEIFTIKGQDLDTNSDIIHFEGKGGSRQKVYAPTDILTMLQGYGRAPHEYIFQSKSGDRLKWGVGASWKRAVDHLGFNDGITDNRQRVRFHTWRHTFASWLAQSGQVTLQELKEQMRHERIDMTLRYAHLIPGHQKKSLSIIDRVLQS